ncbi:MAG TPA: hypothetical protein VNH19_00115 [Candidatus Limnocylindrales bacterium]|nr:hypothetical protein [Candidatus Limnocylindrales bacterium]
MLIKGGEGNPHPKTNTLFPMKTALRNLLFSVLIITSADGQNDIPAFDSGTVVVVEHMKDEIIVATDSRLITENNVAKDTCKIKTYKNIGAFAASGSVHFLRTPDGKSWLWDANRTAMEAFQMARTAKGKEDEATRAASIWGHRGREFFQMPLKATNSEEFIREIHSNNDFGEIVEGIFAVNESGILTVVHAGIFLKEDAGTYTIVARIDPPSIVGTALAMGYGGIVQKFLPTPTAWARTEFLKWKASLPKDLTNTQTEELFISQLVQWTIDSKATNRIGGDVNTVVLDQSGVRWLKRKEYCKDS